MSEVDDRKAAIFEAACRWAEGDGFALVDGRRFEPTGQLDRWLFVGDPRDILVDAYLALLSLTPTQPDREALLAIARQAWPEAGGQSSYAWFMRQQQWMVDKMLALFNGGTKP